MTVIQGHSGMRESNDSQLILSEFDMLLRFVDWVDVILNLSHQIINQRRGRFALRGFCQIRFKKINVGLYLYIINLLFSNLT